MFQTLLCELSKDLACTTLVGCRTRHYSQVCLALLDLSVWHCAAPCKILKIKKGARLQDTSRAQMENAAYAREVAELFASSRRSISPAQLDAAARSASGSFTGVSAFARARSASTGASAAATPQVSNNAAVVNLNRSESTLSMRQSQLIS